eukprot:1159185-Pelagomonas_calceolata.AAC.13
MSSPFPGEGGRGYSWSVLSKGGGLRPYGEVVRPWRLQAPAGTSPGEHTMTSNAHGACVLMQKALMFAGTSRQVAWRARNDIKHIHGACVLMQKSGCQALVSAGASRQVAWRAHNDTKHTHGTCVLMQKNGCQAPASAGTSRQVAWRAHNIKHTDQTFNELVRPCKRCVFECVSCASTSRQFAQQACHMKMHMLGACA